MQEVRLCVTDRGRGGARCRQSDGKRGGEAPDTSKKTGNSREIKKWNMQTSSAANFMPKNKFIRMKERPSLQPSQLHSPRTQEEKGKQANHFSTGKNNHGTKSLALGL